MTLEELIVKIGADVSDYTKGIDEAIAKAGDLESAFSGGAMSAAVTGPLVALGTAALEASANITEGFNAIIVQTGAVGASLDALKGSFDSVFASVPESARQVADALGSISQRLDLTGAPLEALATQMLNLARITGEQVGPMVTSAARAFNAFKISTDDQGASLDYLFSVFQHTGASVQSLTDGLTQYGAQFKSMGLDFQQSAALLGEFEKEGVNASAAMRGLNTAIKTMSAAGVDTSVNGFQTVINYINQASTAAEGLQRSIEVFGSKGGASMYQAIQGGAADVQNLTKGFAAAGDAINSTADRVETMGEKLSKAWGPVELAIAPLGDVLKSFLLEGLQDLQPFIEALGGLGKWFAGLDPTIKEAVVSMGLFVGAIGPVVLAVTKLSEMEVFSGVAAGFNSLAGALGLLKFSEIATEVETAGESIAEAGVVATAGWSGLALTLGAIGVGLVAVTAGVVAVINAQKEHPIDPDTGLPSGGTFSGFGFTPTAFAPSENLPANPAGSVYNFPQPTSATVQQNAAPSAAATAASNALADAKAAQAAAQALQDAWSAFGQQDLAANVIKLQNAYNVLAASGKATEQQLADDWEKVLQAVDAATASVQTFQKYDQAKPFDESSLPSVADQISSAVALNEEARAAAAAAKALNDAKAAAIALNNEAANAAKFGPEMLDQYNALRQSLGEVDAVSGIFAANTKMTVGQMDALVDSAAALDKQLANSANPFAVDVTGAGAKLVSGFNDAAIAADKAALGAGDITAALKLLGVQADKTDMAKVWNAAAVAQAAYAKGEISAYQNAQAQIAAINKQMTETGWSGDLQKQLDTIKNSMIDVGKAVHTEVQTVFDTFGSGLANAITDFGNFGKDIVTTLENVGKQIFTTIFTDLFKSLTKSLVTDLTQTLTTSIVKPITDALGIGIKSAIGGAAAITGAIPAGAPEGATSVINSILGGGTSAAGAGASAAGTAASGAAGAASSATSTLSQLGSIANIASAVTNIASGIVSGMQQAHMESDLQKIEESTRRLDIATEQQPDSIFHNLAVIRDTLLQFTNGGVPFSTLIDLMKQLTDNKDAGGQIRDYLYNTMEPTLQQIAGGSATATTNPDGSVSIPSSSLDAVVQAVKDGSDAIVKAIADAATASATAAGGLVTGADGSQAYINPLPQQPNTLPNPPADTTATTDTTATDTTAAAPVAAAPTFDSSGTSTTAPVAIPASEGIVQATLVVNQSIIDGCASIVTQLQSMGAVGGTGTGTAASGAAAAGPVGAGDGTTRTGAGSIIEGMGGQASAVSSSATAASAATPVMDAPTALAAIGVSADLISAFEAAGVIRVGDPSMTPVVAGTPEAPAAPSPFAGMDLPSILQAQGQSTDYINNLLNAGAIRAGSTSMTPVVSETPVAAAPPGPFEGMDLPSILKAQGMPDADIQNLLSAGAIRAGSKSMTPVFGSGYVDFLHPAANTPIVPGAPNIPDSSSWSPVSSVPGSADLRPVQNISISHVTFQSRSDIDYLMNLVRNQL